MITISICKKSIPQGEEKVVRYFGTVNSNGRTPLDVIADRICDMCTVTRPDVVAVLAGLQKQVIDILRNGDGVSIGELGTIYVRCHSRLAPTEKDCTAASVKSLYVAFKPNSSLSKAVGREKVQFAVKK